MAWMLHKSSGSSWLMASCSWSCLYCWQDVYRSTYPGNSLCMFTGIYSDALTVQRPFKETKIHIKSVWCSGQIELKSVFLTFHNRYSVSKPETCCFQVSSSGKCAIIPQASFNMTVTVLCALPVRFPSNAVTCLKSNRCTKVTSHHKCTVILKSKMARTKVIVDIYIISLHCFHERDLRKHLFAHNFLYKKFPLTSLYQGPRPVEWL